MVPATRRPILWVLLLTIGVQLGVTLVVQASTPILEGYRDHDYPNNVAGNEEVTSEKPESKLWWNDGYWWASMYSNGDGRYNIFRLEENTQTWEDTGTALDDRIESRADVLWADNKLYVVSHLWDGNGGQAENPEDSGRLYRYSYNAGTYTLDTGFPVEVNGASSESLVIAKDSLGQLWVTWTQDSLVMINHSVGGNDAVWSTPFALDHPAATTAGDGDDLSSIIAYGDHVGIMWSNQDGDEEMYFAVHEVDTDPELWTVELAFSITGDDHINLKRLGTDDDGNIYAVIKGGSSSHLIVVLVCQWDASSFCSDTADWDYEVVYDSSTHNPTRPMMLIDTTNRDLYVFTRNHDENQDDGIYYKVTDLDNISFTTGDIGIPFIKSETETGINDPTSTKQNVNSTTGLVVLASDKSAQYYFHNFLPLDGVPQHVLSVSITGNGAVTQDPPGLTYDHDTEVILTAVPDPGWKFDGWSGGATGATSPVTVTMDASKTVNAFFSELPSNERTLTPSVSPGGAGSVTLDPAGGVYTVGQTVTLTANANTGYLFREWSGVPIDGSTQNPVTITMDDNYTIVAEFDVVPPEQYELTANTTGNGVVNLTPDQPAGGYYENTNVTAVADPDPGWAFTGWSGDLPTGADPSNPTLNIVMDGAKTITAAFTPQYTLDVTWTGSGDVTLNPPGGTYLQGTEVTLTAAPEPSWVFREWGGDATGSDNPLTVTMDGDKAVSATFALPEHTLTVNTDGDGSVELNPPGGEYAEGEFVTLTATPDPGWSFVAWTGDFPATNNPYTIRMEGDTALTALFTPMQHTLNLNILGQGNVTLDPPGGSYGHGATVTLTANPEPGWTFSSWSGDLDGSDNPAMITMDAEKTVSATFVQQETGIQIEVSANPMTATLSQEITYSYVVANIGEATLNDVTVVDDRLGPVTLDKTTLASGETAVGTLTYQPVLGDLPGPLQNVATATATSVLDEDVSDSDEISVSLRQLSFIWYMPLGFGNMAPAAVQNEEQAAPEGAEEDAPGLIIIRELDEQP